MCGAPWIILCLSQHCGGLVDYDFIPIRPCLLLGCGGFGRCGGGGTLNEVVSGAVGFAGAEIAFYPCGSGNDFIKCFGTAAEFSNLETVVSGRAVPVDLIKVNEDRYCVNIFSVGVDADVAAGIPRWRRVPLCGGKTAYNLSLAECLVKPIGKKLTVNGEPMTLTIIAACNGRVYGGGYMAAPEADTADGLMDIISVRKLSRLRIAKVISQYKSGQHIKDAQVADNVADCLSFRRSDRLVISAATPFSANIDGEILRMSTASLSVLPGAFRFVAPAGANS